MEIVVDRKSTERGEGAGGRNGEHILLVLRLYRPGQRRHRREVGSVRGPSPARPHLPQPLARPVPRRRPLHPHLLPRRPRRDQDQGPSL